MCTLRGLALLFSVSCGNILNTKQTKSYTDERFDEKGSYEIIAHKEDDTILKEQIRSRHTSNKTYNLWIEYTQGLNPITDGIVGAEVVLALLGVVHMWLQCFGI